MSLSIVYVYLKCYNYIEQNLYKKKEKECYAANQFNFVYPSYRYWVYNHHSHSKRRH